jgi:hypothetical protein
MLVLPRDRDSVTLQHRVAHGSRRITVETRVGPCKLQGVPSEAILGFRPGPKRDHVTASDSDASLQVHPLLSVLLLPIIKESLARRYRQKPMAGIFTAFYLRKGSLPILEIRATYRACPERTFWGKGDRSVARPAEYFLGGAQPIWTCQGSP